MAFSLKFYADAGLNTELPSISSRQVFDGSGQPNDFTAYIGSTALANQFRASSNPGVDQIALTPVVSYLPWSAGLSVLADDIIVPTTPNGFKYQAQNSGTTGGSEPSFPGVIGNTVDDNGVIWELIDQLHDTDEITLALNAIDLDTNTPGAALNIGVQLLSEVANALPIHIRVDQDSHPLGRYTDINIETNELDEEAV